MTPDREQVRRDAPSLSQDEALAAINALRCNIIGAQDASWSNMVYPLVAILNAAGFIYEAPTEADMDEHRACYGGAGGFPRG